MAPRPLPSTLSGALTPLPRTGTELLVGCSGVQGLSGETDLWGESNLGETESGLGETEPSLGETDPGLGETDPGLEETESGLGESNLEISWEGLGERERQRKGAATNFRLLGACNGIGLTNLCAAVGTVEFPHFLSAILWHISLHSSSAESPPSSSSSTTSSSSRSPSTPSS